MHKLPSKYRKSYIVSGFTHLRLRNRPPWCRMCTPRCGSVCGCDCCCRRTPWPRPTSHVLVANGAGARPGGEGTKNPTLGQCSRHLSWPAACFPAGFSTSIYFPVRLFHCSSVCPPVWPSAELFIRMYFAIAQCEAMRFASRNLCCPALYSGLDALDAATRISTLFIFICPV